MTYSEKYVRVVDYFGDHVDKKGGVLTVQKICNDCAMPYNGHTLMAIMAVCHEYKDQVTLSKIETGVAGRTRYEIEVMS